MRIPTQRSVTSILFHLLLTLGFLSLVRQVLHAEDRPDLADRFNEVVSIYHQRGYFNGAVLVAQHGKVIYSKGIGEANFELHTPNTPETKFDIASITKQFTAALIFQQAAKGNLRLDGTVSEYLAWYRKDSGQRMTVEELLHHTSGLPADFDNPQFSDSAEAIVHYEPKVFAEKFCQPNLVAEPGTKWAYSNCGYILLGLILEKVSSTPFSVLLQREILTPLGMKNTGMDQNNLERLGGATGYQRLAGPRYKRGPYLDRGRIFSAGAMYSTVEDLFLWDQALSGGTLFSEGIREQIFAPGMNNWAGGWFIAKTPPLNTGQSSPMAEMRGDMPGNFFSWIRRYPQEEAVIVVLRNAYGSTEHFEDALQSILFQQVAKIPAASAKDLLARSTLTHPTMSLLALFSIVVVVSKFRREKNRTDPKSPHSVCAVEIP